MTPSNRALAMLKPWIDDLLTRPAADSNRCLKMFQAMLPGRLPDDYTAVLLELGQAVGLERNVIASIEAPPPPDLGYFTNVGPDQELSILYGLGSELLDPHNVAAAWNILSAAMPKGFVPIGESTGDQICLDVSEAGHGRIYHWFLEGDPGPDVDGRPGRGNTFLLAHSFTDLCARLRPPAGA